MSLLIPHEKENECMRTIYTYTSTLHIIAYPHIPDFIPSYYYHTRRVKCGIPNTSHTVAAKIHEAHKHSHKIHSVSTLFRTMHKKSNWRSGWIKQNEREREMKSFPQRCNIHLPFHTCALIQVPPNNVWVPAVIHFSAATAVAKGFFKSNKKTELFALCVFYVFQAFNQRFYESCIVSGLRVGMDI